MIKNVFFFNWTMVDWKFFTLFLFIKSFDILPKQKFYQLMLSPLTYVMLFSLNLQISVLFTYEELSSPLQYKLEQNFVFALLKLILSFFASPWLSLIPSAGPSLNSKVNFLIISMTWWIIINSKNYNNSSKAITKTPHIFSIKYYS